MCLDTLDKLDEWDFKFICRAFLQTSLFKQFTHLEVKLSCNFHKVQDGDVVLASLNATHI